MLGSAERPRSASRPQLIDDFSLALFMAATTLVQIKAPIPVLLAINVTVFFRCNRRMRSLVGRGLWDRQSRRMDNRESTANQGREGEAYGEH